MGSLSKFHHLLELLGLNASTSIQTILEVGKIIDNTTEGGVLSVAGDLERKHRRCQPGTIREQNYSLIYNRFHGITGDGV